MGTVTKHTEVRQLRCDLTEAELAGKAERIAEVMQEIRDTEAALRADKARHKGKLETLTSERDRVLHDYSTATEQRDVECALQLDFEARRASWVRLDTGEPLSDRPLSDTERQQPLFDDSAARDEGDGEDEPDPDAELPRATQRGRKRTTRSETTAPPAL